MRSATPHARTQQPMRSPPLVHSGFSAGQPLWTITVWPVTPQVLGSELDAKRLSMAERADPRAMRSEVSAQGVVGRETAYRWESGACAKVRPLKSWQMKPAGDHIPDGIYYTGHDK